MENNVNDIISLYEEAKKLKEYFQNYPERLTEYKMLYPNTNCDKYEQGFNEDARYKACASHSVYFSSKKGNHGDSNCYQILDITFPKQFWKYFDEYLNDNKKDIFNYISRKMIEECKIYKKDLQQEVNYINKIIEKIK